MKKSTIAFIFILLILTILLGYNYFTRPFYEKLTTEVEQKIETEEEKDKVNSEGKEGALEHKIDLSQVAVEEKVAHLVAAPLVVDADLALGFSDDNNLTFIQKYKPGLVTLFGENISKNSAQLAIAKVRANYSDSNYQPVIAVDHEGGSVQRLRGRGFSELPSWQKMCETETKVSLEIFAKSAKELAEIGINVVYAPVLDVSENNSILKTRVCPDYDKALDTAYEYINAFADHRIMSVIKHFPGIGNIKKDLHNKTEEVEINIEDALMFQRMLNKYPNIGVMTAHIKLKDKLDGLPCSLSSVCLREFVSTYQEAIVFTDALDMKSALEKGDGSERTLSEVSVEAIMAGNDVLVYGEGVTAQELETVMNDLIKEYEANEEFKSKADDSVRKLLKLRVAEE